MSTREVKTNTRRRADLLADRIEEVEEREPLVLAVDLEELLGVRLFPGFVGHSM